MGLLSRTAVLGFFGLVALPSLAPDAYKPADSALVTSSVDPVSAVEALRFAGGVASEVGSICARQPDLCETGRKIAAAAMVRAQQGAGIAASMIADKASKKAPVEADGVDPVPEFPIPGERPGH